MDYIFLYNYNFQPSMNMHKKQSYYQQIELSNYVALFNI